MRNGRGAQRRRSVASAARLASRAAQAVSPENTPIYFWSYFIYEMPYRRRSRSRSASRNRRRSSSRRSYRTSSARRRYSRTRRYSKSRRGSYQNARNYGDVTRVLRGSTATTVQRGPLPFNQAYLARLTCTHDFALSLASVAPFTCTVEDIFRLNSPYDPLLNAASTIQAYGFDQLAMFYKRYHVLFCKVHVVFYNPDRDGFHVGIRLRSSDDHATQDASMTYINVATRTVSRVIHDTGSQKQIFDFSLKPRSVLKLTKHAYNDEADVWSAAVNANPSGITPLMEPFAFSTVGASGAVRCKVSITYYTRFYDPVLIDQSTLASLLDPNLNTDGDPSQQTESQ